MTVYSDRAIRQLEMDATNALNQHDYARYANIMDKWHDATGVPRDGGGKGGSTHKSQDEDGGGAARKDPDWAHITGDVIKGAASGGGEDDPQAGKPGYEATSTSPDEGGGAARKDPDWADITGEVVKGGDAALDPGALNASVEAKSEQDKKDRELDQDLDQEV